jgi:hypothetical protein
MEREKKVDICSTVWAIKAEVNGLVSRPDFTTAQGRAGHPGFGRLSAPEWVQLADMHLRHHVRQKRRIDAALFF